MMFPASSTPTPAHYIASSALIKGDNFAGKNVVSTQDVSYVAIAIPTKATPGGRGLQVSDLPLLSDWELAVICLPNFDWWTDDTLALRQLIPIVGAKNSDALERVARIVFPKWEGRYNLQFPHICRLLRKHLKGANVRLSRDELLRRATQRVEFNG